MEVEKRVCVCVGDGRQVLINPGGAGGARVPRSDRQTHTNAGRRPVRDGGARASASAVMLLRECY